MTIVNHDKTSKRKRKLNLRTEYKLEEHRSSKTDSERLVYSLSYGPVAVLDHFERSEHRLSILSLLEITDD